MCRLIELCVVCRSTSHQPRLKDKYRTAEDDVSWFYSLGHVVCWFFTPWVYTPHTHTHTHHTTPHPGSFPQEVAAIMRKEEEEGVEDGVTMYKDSNIFLKVRL